MISRSSPHQNTNMKERAIPVLPMDDPQNARRVYIDAHELKMTLKKIDRTWLITRVESVALGH